jgi:hypothetical protein
MSTDNQDLRNFTAKTDGTNFSFRVNTFLYLSPDQLRLEYSSSHADKIIYCYDRITQQQPFDMNLGINCLNKYSLAHNLA